MFPYFTLRKIYCLKTLSSDFLNLYTKGTLAKLTSLKCIFLICHDILYFVFASFWQICSMLLRFRLLFFFLKQCMICLSNHLYLFKIFSKELWFLLLVLFLKWTWSFHGHYLNEKITGALSVLNGRYSFSYMGGGVESELQMIQSEGLEWFLFLTSHPQLLNTLHTLEMQD